MAIFNGKKLEEANAKVTKLEGELNLFLIN